MYCLDNIIFTCPGYTHYYFTFKELVPQSQLDAVKNNIGAGTNEWKYITRKDQKNGPKIRMYGVKFRKFQLTLLRMAL